MAWLVGVSSHGGLPQAVLSACGAPADDVGCKYLINAIITVRISRLRSLAPPAYAQEQKSKSAPAVQREREKELGCAQRLPALD
jgi:hypothetical protein